ncbi:MAG: hypothetical protein HZA52_02990 [Planctomycetes bacterium]|nr:hypothetical protein [Planctomycetota bacterium]
MLRSCLVTSVLLLSSCSQAPVPAPAEGLAARFPAPDRRWTIDVRDGQAKLVDLVRSFEGASGERITFSDAVGKQLAAKRVGLTSNTEVEPEQVYTWFESLIANEGYRVAVTAQTGPRVLVLWTNASFDASGEKTPLHVGVDEPEQLGELDRHPALYVQTVLDVTPLEARTLQNSLRALGGRLDNLVAVGESNSVILLGCGAEVAGMVRLLQSAMEQERARLAPVVGATDGDEKR